MSKSTSQILLVDDQPINLQAALAVLQEEGYRVLVAKEGRRALTIAETRQPDLILLDVVMADMDGYETCRRLKLNPATAHIPVIFLTAKAGEDDVRQGFEAGGVDYLAKPFRSQELKARVRTHLELVSAHNHLRQLSDLKSQFMAMAAHDLKNPLNAVTGFTELLILELEQNGVLRADDDQTMMMLSTIKRTANHMLELIHEILESEAIHVGAVELDPECTDLDGVARDVVELNSRHAANKEITLHYQSREGCIALVDRRRIYEAYDNLVNNAVKYSPPGSEISIDLSRDVPAKGMVRFAVRDRGPGLSREDQEKLFVKFQKLSPRPTGGETSTGLGLFIVKTLVEQQGGHVSAHSNGPGTGCTFHIDLPIASSCPVPPA